MQTLRFFARCAVAATLFLAAPLSASAQDLETLGKTGEWEIIYSELPDGLRFCGASRYYPIDAWLHIDRVNATPETIVTLYAAGAPQMQQGQIAPATVVFELQGGPRRIATNGLASSTTQYHGLSVYADGEIMDLLQSANGIAIEYLGFRTPVLALEDSRAAAAAVVNCVAARF